MFFVLFALGNSEIPPSLPHRSEASSASLGYFKTFESSRRGSKILGFKINPKSNLVSIANDYLNPYKSVNYTATILNVYNQIIPSTTIPGAEPMPKITHKETIKDMLLQHLLSFVTYAIPIIAVTIIAIIILAARLFVHRKLPYSVYYNGKIKRCSLIVFIVIVACCIPAVILLILGCATFSGVIDTIDDLPQTIDNVIQDFQPYYSKTRNKLDDLIDLWKTKGKDAIDVLASNLTEFSNDIMDPIQKLSLSFNNINVIYTSGAAPTIQYLQEELYQYDRSDLAELLTDDGILGTINTVQENINAVISIANEILSYAGIFDDYSGDLEGSDEEIYQQLSKSVLSFTKRVLEDKNYTLNISAPNLNFMKKYIDICRTFILVCAVVMVLSVLLTIVYFIVVLPCFEKESLLVAKYSCAVPTVLIALLAVIALIFAAVGGIFAYYARNDLELTLDTTIGSIFDIFPDRTLIIPDFSFAYITEGTFDESIHIGDIVFSPVNIFKRLIEVDSDVGLYKALNLYSILNITDFVYGIGTDVSNLGNTIKLPQSVQNFIINLYNDIYSNVPESFADFYSYMYDDHKTKAQYVSENLTASGIVDPDIQDQLDQLDNYSYQMEQIYNDAYNLLTETLYNIMIEAPDLLIQLAKFACTHFGAAIEESASIIDEALNQIPVGFVLGAYNVVHNAFFSDLIEGASYFTSGCLIFMVSFTIMLICIMLYVPIRPFDEQTSDNYVRAP